MFLHYFELTFSVSKFPSSESEIENLFDIRKVTTIMRNSFDDLSRLSSIKESKNGELTMLNTSMVECDAANKIVKIRFSISSSLSVRSMDKVRSKCISTAEKLTGCSIARSSSRLEKVDPGYGDWFSFPGAAVSA